MANRDFKNVQALNREVKLISGVINLNSSAAVTGTVGLGFTCTKQATGVYRIQFDEKYNTFVGGAVTLVKAAAAALWAEFVSEDVDNTANGFVDVRTINAAGAATDTAAAIDISFSLNVKNTSVRR